MKTNKEKLRHIEENVESLTKFIYILFESILDLLPKDNKELVESKIRGSSLYGDIAKIIYSLVKLVIDFICKEGMINETEKERNNFYQSIHEAIKKSKIFKIFSS